MNASTAFLVMSVTFAALMTGYDLVIRPILMGVIYDDSAPINFLDARLEQSRLLAGATEIRFSFDYDGKRAACHPPLARPGLIRFRIWTRPQDYIWLMYENRSYAPATMERKTMPFRAIPLPPLPPGRYSFQWVATYNCIGSSRPLTVEGPRLPFEIVM